jgi:hypothetical protein
MRLSGRSRSAKRSSSRLLPRERQSCLCCALGVTRSRLSSDRKRVLPSSRAHDVLNVLQDAARGAAPAATAHHARRKWFLECL